LGRPQSAWRRFTDALKALITAKEPEVLEKVAAEKSLPVASS